MKNRRRHHHPYKALGLALRAAATNIAFVQFRELGAKAGERIPVLMAERGAGHKAEMARLGRKALLALREIKPEEHAEAQAKMRGYADALLSRFEETSFIALGKRRRSGDQGVARAV